jgi:hypothetical protein
MSWDGVRSSLVEIVIGVMALLFVLFVATGVFVGVRVTRAVKRGVERTGSQVRRGVDQAALRARSGQPGPVGELARRRLELRESIDGTRRALESDVTRDPLLSEAVGLLDRLQEHARQLDGEMRLLMDSEPDRNRLAERLPELRGRVMEIKESADSLRHAAQERAGSRSAEELTALREQIEIESGALRPWPEEGTGGAIAGAGAGAGAGELGSGESPEPGPRNSEQGPRPELRKGRPQSAS